MSATNSVKKRRNSPQLLLKMKRAFHSYIPYSGLSDTRKGRNATRLVGEIAIKIASVSGDVKARHSGGEARKPR